MQLIDSQYLQALQQSIGGPGLNLVENSPLFGPLPQLQTLPPGSTITQGSSFFGPQTPPIYLFSPNLLGGRLIGYGLQSYMAQRGQAYFPTGVNLADLLRSREFERGLRETTRIGTFQDEERLARVIERALRAFYQTDGPVIRARANALAQINIGPAEALGLTRLLPGGSAADFARQFYLAGQNLRDFTNQRYNLGLSDNQIKVMTQRLLDYFGPGGTIDVQKTRGLPLQDIGQLAGQLTSFGLLRTEVTPQELTQATRDLGINLDRLGRADLETLKGVVRPISVGRQLQSYAEVVARLREIIGDPNAPIPQIIQELQNLTGGRMQEYTPAQLEQMLNRIRETARTANISMNIMRSIVAEGATMYRQMGLAPTLGGIVSAQVAAATVAAQTVAAGPGPGRLHPDRETDIRFRLMTRGIQSSGFRISTNIMRLLEPIDTSNLTPEQRQIYQQIYSRARQFYYDERNLHEALVGLEQLGIGRTAALMVTRQPVPASYIEAHQDRFTQLTAAQARDVRRSLGRSGRLFTRVLMADPNSTIARRLQDLAAQANMSVEEVGEAIAQSYIMAGGDTRQARLNYIRSRGINMTQRELAQLETQLNAFPVFRREYKARSLERPEQLRALFGPAQITAIEESHERIEERVAGQQILADLHAEYRSDTMARLLRAAEKSPTSLSALVTTAFGFVPREEFMKELRKAGGEKALSRLNQIHQEIREAREKGDIATVKQKEAEARRILAGFKEIETRYGSIFETRHLREFLNKAKAQDIQRLARVAGDQEASAEERFAASQKLAEFTLQFSDQDIGRLILQLPPEDRNEFLTFIQAARAEAFDFRRYERETDPARKEELRRSLLRTGPDIFKGYVGLIREAGLAEEVRFSRGRSYTFDERVAAAKRFVSEINAFKSARSTEERRKAYETLRTDILKNREAVFRRGPNGRLEVDVDFIRLMVSAAGHTGQEAADLTEKLRLEFESLREGAAFITSPRIGPTPDEEQLREAQEIIQPLDLNLKEFKGIKIPEYTEIQRAYIYGGGEPIEGVSPELQRAREEYSMIQGIMSQLNLPLPRNRLERQYLIRQLQEKLRRSGLYDRKGRLKSEEVIGILLGQYGSAPTPAQIQGAAEQVISLSRLGPLVTADDDAAYRILSEVQGQPLESGTGLTSGKRGKAEEKSEDITIRFVDAETGEDLGKDIRIEVSTTKTKDAGRDASKFLKY